MQIYLLVFWICNFQIYLWHFQFVLKAFVKFEHIKHNDGYQDQVYVWYCRIQNLDIYVLLCMHHQSSVMRFHKVWHFSRTIPLLYDVRQIFNRVVQQKVSYFPFNLDCFGTKLIKKRLYNQESWSRSCWKTTIDSSWN